ncbi:cyclase/dehydrase, partial [Spirillospora sp. NPDC000708]
LTHADEIEGWRGEIRDSEVVKTHEDALKEEEDESCEGSGTKSSDSSRSSNPSTSGTGNGRKNGSKDKAKDEAKKEREEASR